MLTACVNYDLKITAKFEKKFHKIIPKHLQEDTWRRLLKLRDNPFVGKPLGDQSFREMKVGKFRIYFIIIQHEVIVWIIDISSKKDQQEIIDIIRQTGILEYVKNLKEGGLV